MADSPVRTVGVSFAAIVGLITASTFVLTGLAVGVYEFELSIAVVSRFGKWPAASAFFGVGFVMLLVTACVYQLYRWSRRPALVLHVLSAAGFGYMLATVGLEIIPLVLFASNVIATFGLFNAGPVFEHTRTDTSDMHATDIGTGLR
ncbi:hypothetical protein [Haloarchaeobius sp. HRN-SO-5]|uniref:hypothetical protein n=1 Tax=Haloarchaeobius sp. HRN-SO-5 TaxID=3446118 RepID=UPI003EBF475B